MKTIIITLAITISLTGWSQNTDLATGTESFEAWSNNLGGELPTHWDGFNRIVEFMGQPIGNITCVTKDSVDPFDGDYSLKLTNESVLGGPAVTGLITNGDFDVDLINQTGEILGGDSITEAPLQLTGWFKYTPQENDTAFIAVTFSKNGNEIGSGRLEIMQTVIDWTAFTVEIDFPNGDIPDSVNVVMASSNTTGEAPVGSVLEIDAIKFVYGHLAITKSKTSTTVVYPNPSKGNIYLKELNEGSKRVNVLNSLGQIVASQMILDLEMGMDLSQLQSGYYFLQIIGEGQPEMHQIQIN